MWSEGNPCFKLIEETETENRPTALIKQVKRANYLNTWDKQYEIYIKCIFLCKDAVELRERMQLEN